MQRGCTFKIFSSCEGHFGSAGGHGHCVVDRALGRVACPRYEQVLWVAAAHDMLRPRKDAYYDLNALVVSLPIGLVSWAEALCCDSFLGQSAITFKSLGGHVWYDGAIPISMFVYYAIVLGMRPAKGD